MSAVSELDFKKKNTSSTSMSANHPMPALDPQTPNLLPVEVTTQVLKAVSRPVIKAPGIGLALASGKEGEGSAVIGQEVGGATA